MSLSPNFLYTIMSSGCSISNLCLVRSTIITSSKLQYLTVCQIRAILGLLFEHGFWWFLISIFEKNWKLLDPIYYFCFNKTRALLMPSTILKNIKNKLELKSIRDSLESWKQGKFKWFRKMGISKNLAAILKFGSHIECDETIFWNVKHTLSQIFSSHGILTCDRIDLVLTI